ncbi:trehalose 6-phosphate phosphatase [Auriculariales sp. MPI-PUGE-AT-0066]|nr:trehalose 6-phosphate phosphatase [Auriculariales sp. MPI-PUGE-AT-0066]
MAALDVFSSAPEMTRDITDLRATVDRLAAEHRSRGSQLSGRVVHVAHYLPIIANLSSRPASLLSPPKTPEPGQANTLGASGATWSLHTRHGHDAMFSGIRSLSNDYEQIIVGWIGDIQAGPQKEHIPTDSLAQEDRAALDLAVSQYTEPDVAPSQKGVSYVPVWLEDKVAHGHYDGYSKAVLWPLFHYLLWQDVAHEAAPEDYAKRVQAILKPGDLVWVHDYHLLLLPRQLRNLAPDAFIGLFIHTPFPSSEVFRCLPRRNEILDGMVGANLVCFQTYSYARHFISSCVRVNAYESSPGGGVDVQGHLVSIANLAVGIDAARVEHDTHRPGIQPKLESLRTLYEGKKIIVGRDKLDAVKGVLQKLKGFEKLLRDYPQYRGNVVLIQLERQVSEAVAHINGEFGSLDFIPVHHYHQSIGKDEFYALLSAADLALITPLRDGMNTTSMEFVICQQKTKKSPLVLSEFMGIAGTMPDALQINPWDLGGLASAIDRGLTMSDDEKERRHEALHKVVTTHTSTTWALALAHSTPELDRAHLKRKYDAASKRLLLFDYDVSTLTPIVRVPSAAVPSPAALEALEKLSADPKNIVWIISGRDTPFLLQHLGHIRGLGMSAEHGCFMRQPNSDMDSWVEEIFRYYTERTTGSFITWHYRASDPDWGNNLVPKRPIEVLVGKKNLEVRPIAINKGEIVKRIVYENPDAEFVFCAGDDKTDEDMFRALLLFPLGATEATVPAPVSAELFDDEAHEDADKNARQLVLKPEGLFPTAVGPSSKRTLAAWHVTSPQEVVTSMLGLVGSSTQYEVGASEEL